MMDYQALRTLIETYGPGWDTDDPNLLVAWLREEGTVTMDREFIPVREIFPVIDFGDFKSVDDQDWIVMSWQLFDEIDVVSPHSLRDRYVAGLKEPSLSAFLALIPISVSRLTKAGLGQVVFADIVEARKPEYAA